MFAFVQTVRHRDYFLPVGNTDEDSHAPPPAHWIAWTSLGLPMLTLVVGTLTLGSGRAAAAGAAANGHRKAAKRTMADDPVPQESRVNTLHRAV